MTDRNDERPTKGRQFRHDDGTIEVVFATEGERVLTVLEYPTRRAFERRIHDATDEGIHQEVADLPDVEAFVDPETNANSGTDDVDRETSGEGRSTEDARE